MVYPCFTGRSLIWVGMVSGQLLDSNTHHVVFRNANGPIPVELVLLNSVVLSNLPIRLIPGLKSAKGESLQTFDLQGDQWVSTNWVTSLACAIMTSRPFEPGEVGRNWMAPHKWYKMIG